LWNRRRQKPLATSLLLIPCLKIQIDYAQGCFLKLGDDNFFILNIYEHSLYSILYRYRSYVWLFGAKLFHANSPNIACEMINFGILCKSTPRILRKTSLVKDFFMFSSAAKKFLVILLQFRLELLNTFCILCFGD